MAGGKGLLGLLRRTTPPPANFDEMARDYPARQRALAPSADRGIVDRIGTGTLNEGKIQDRYHGWINPAEQRTREYYDSKAGFPFDFNGVHQHELMDDLLDAQPGDYWLRRRHEVGTDPRYSLDGDIHDDAGDTIGRIQRRYNPAKGTADFDVFRLNSDAQRSGISRRLMKAQFDKYPEMGINKVNVNVGLDRGGYAWAKLGAQPGASSWPDAAREVRHNADSLLRQGHIDEDTHGHILSLTQGQDPKAIWQIADLEHPGMDKTNGGSLGNRLLSGTSWHGFYDLEDPDVLARIDAYTSKK